MSFSGVSQPIKYIAPAFITGDSLVVFIGAVESEITSGGLEYNILQKDSMKFPDAKINIPSPRLLSILQAHGASAVCLMGSVTIKRKACEEAPQCSSEPFVFPSFEAEIVNKDSYNAGQYNDGCYIKDALGTFSPVFSNSGKNEVLTEFYDVNVCYNGGSNKWNISIPDQLIKIKTVKYLCEGKLVGILRVNNVETDVWEGDKCYRALEDFKAHFKYPIVVFKYIIPYVLETHEIQHMLEFEEIIALNIDFLKAHINIIQSKFNCEDFDSYEDAKKRIEKTIKNKINKYLRDCCATFYAQKDEKKTHGSSMVKIATKQFIDQLGCE